VEVSFPIVMRFRTDPFLGLSTEVGSQRKEEGDRVDRVVAQCMARLDLDRRLSVYQLAHPMSSADELELVDNFVLCARATSSAVADLVSEASLDSYDSVVAFVTALTPPNSGLPPHVLFAVSDCQQQMTGPTRVFRDGHPWFTP
jgi:hypothetical protein